MPVFGSPFDLIDVVRGYDAIVGAPTAAVVRAFTVGRVGRGAVVRWRTAVETGLLGFHVFRGGSRVNRTMVRARGGHRGAGYAVRDASVRAGAATYRLVGVRDDGSRATLAHVRLSAVRR